MDELDERLHHAIAEGIADVAPDVANDPENWPFLGDLVDLIADHVRTVVEAEAASVQGGGANAVLRREVDLWRARAADLQVRCDVLEDEARSARAAAARASHPSTT